MHARTGGRCGSASIAVLSRRDLVSCASTMAILTTTQAKRSWTVDTVESLRMQHGGVRQDELVLGDLA
eukprot:4687644-Amphidinium_carterae.1